MAQSKNLYVLPFLKKELIYIVSDPRAHFAHFKNAIDFVLPLGAKILAAKAGIVVDVKVNSNKGGPDSKYNNIKYLNLITIKHTNAEYSQYMHLKHRSALVKVHEKVKTGQPIALSGNTGFTTIPHLHFHVFKTNKSKMGWESLKIRFTEKICVHRKLVPLAKNLQKTLRELKKVKRDLRNN